MKKRYPAEGKFHVGFHAKRRRATTFKREFSALEGKKENTKCIINAARRNINLRVAFHYKTCSVKVEIET
jgi:hypothetical protein